MYELLTCSYFAHCSYFCLISETKLSKILGISTFSSWIIIQLKASVKISFKGAKKFLVLVLPLKPDYSIFFIFIIFYYNFSLFFQDNMTKYLTVFFTDHKIVLLLYINF